MVISKEEYIKRFKKYFMSSAIGKWDTEVNRKKYVDGIDFEDEYKVYLMEAEEGTTVEQAIALSGNYYYMMYPEY